MTSIADNIRIERARRKWTQSDLSKRSTVAVSVICNSERGNTVPKVETVQRLADAFGLPITALMIDASPKHPVNGAAGQTNEPVTSVAHSPNHAPSNGDIPLTTDGSRPASIDPPHAQRVPGHLSPQSAPFEKGSADVSTSLHRAVPSPGEA